MTRSHYTLSMRCCRSCEVAFHAIGEQRYCDTCWASRFDHAREAARRETAPAALDPDLLGRAIRLSHPDAHPRERFEIANRTVSELLALREQVAA